MKKILALCFLFGTLLTLPLIAQPTYTITHEPTYQEAAVGDTFQIKVFYHSNLADTTVFSRMGVDYDSTVVKMIAIENGDDVPSGAYAQPFINWGPVCAEPFPTKSQFAKGSLEWAREQVFISQDPCDPPYTEWISQHVYLGQFWELGCSNNGPVTCEQWAGHAITYTLVAVGSGTTSIFYPEFRARLNYVDMAPWTCYAGYVAEYTSDADNLIDCINLLYLPSTTTVVVADTPSSVPILVENVDWTTIKRLYK